MSRILRGGVWLAERATLAIVAIVALIAVPSHIVPAARSLFGPSDITEFQRAHSRSHSFMMFDGAGRYVGLMSADTARDQDYIDRLPGRIVLGEVVFFNDHKTVPVSDAPPYFYACLAHLEDRYRGGLDNPYGVSWSGVARIPFTLAGLGVGGGSTLEMQLARSMWQSYPGQEARAGTTREERKLNEWEAAPRLRSVLTQDFEDETALRRWIAEHVSLARGADKQGSVYGVEASGMFVFGKRAAALTPAEQIVLASAVRKPLRFRPSVRSRRSALRSLIGAADAPGRALLCAAPGASYRTPEGERLVFDDEEERRDARAALLALADAYDGPHLDPELQTLAPELTKHAKGPRFGPLTIGDYFIGRAASEAAAQLEDYFAAHPEADRGKHLFRGKLTAARITLDAAQHTRFTRNVDELFGPWGRRLVEAMGPRFSAPVLKHLLIAAVDEQGRVVRYYNSSGDRLLFGRALTREENAYSEGPYDVSRQTRTMGSVYKTAAAMLLAEAGETDPAGVWLNVCLPGVTQRCMNRATGSGDQPKVSAREAFAESLNAAVARRLDGKVRRDRMRAFADALGVRVADPTVRASVNMVLGNYRARPFEVLMLMSMARAYAEADWSAPIPPPHIVSEIEAFDAHAGAASGWRRVIGEPKILTDFVAPGPDPTAAAAFVGSVMSAPLCMKTTNLTRPTLRDLNFWCAEKNADIALHLAKTGTVPGIGPSGRNEKDWWIGGTIRFADGRAYSYVVALGPDPDGGAFAQNLSARQLAPFVEALLQSLQGDG